MSSEADIFKAEATLSETEANLRELQNFRDGLKKHVHQWRSQTQNGGKMAAEFCAFIETHLPHAKRGSANIG